MLVLVVLFIAISSIYFLVLGNIKAAPIATPPTAPIFSLFSIPSNTAVINGVVKKIIIGPDGETYIAGQFSYIGEGQGGSVVLDKKTGEAKPFPQITGTVHAVAPDGDGGFYIGGTFSKAGTAKKINLVRVLKNGVIDESFTPNPNGIIYSLYFDESSKILYVGGTFTSIFKKKGDRFRTERIRLAAFDTSKKWVLTNLSLNINSTVTAISFDKNKNIIYIGGTFTTISGQKRNRLASINATNSALLDWNPNANGKISSIVVDTKRNLIYVSGDFSQIGDQKRKYIASILSNGKVGTLNLTPNAAVYSLALNPDDGTLYVGGLFTLINGKENNYLTAINTVGELSSFKSGLVSAVFSLSLDEKNNTLYVSGGFNSDSQITYIGAIDSKTGLKIDSFIPNVNMTPYVRAMGISDGSLLISNLSIIKNGGRVYNIARLQSDGKPDLSWNIKIEGIIYTMVVDPVRKVLYVGGSFSSIDGNDRQNLASINIENKIVTDWNPQVNGPVYSLIPNFDKNTIYVGGVFQKIGDNPKANIAGIDIMNGQVISMNTDMLGVTGGVYTMALNKAKDILYAGGFFNSLVFASSTDFSLPDSVLMFPSGSENYVLSFGRQMASSSDNQVYSCTASNSRDSTFYGCNIGLNTETVLFSCTSSRINFTSSSTPVVINNPSCSKKIPGKGAYLVALNVETGAPIPWNPTPNGGVTSIVLNEDKNIAYIAGRFSSVSGEIRKYLAAVDLLTGAVLPWDPKANNIVSDIELDKEHDIIYAGGHFTVIGGGRRSFIAGLDPNISSGKASLWNPLASGIVYDISLNENGTLLNAGGYFTAMFSYEIPYFSSFKVKTIPTQ